MEVEQCVFCRIVQGHLPAHIIADSDEVIVFLSLENHPLIVPKQHIQDIYALPPILGSAVMAAAIQVARAVRQSLACEGVYLSQANEAAAGQDVFHYHMHVYPCWAEKTEGAIRQFARQLMNQQDQTEASKQAIASKLRRALANWSSAG